MNALQRIAPEAPPAYFCPLCAQGFGRDALEDRTLTVEHAPPEAVGGRPVCLTCDSCNNGAGHTVDAHMARREALLAFVTGTMDEFTPARFEIGGASMNADYYHGPAGVMVFGAPKRNSQQARASITEALDEAHRSQSLSFRVTPSKLSYNERLNLTGWLRSAYLIAFAALGYQYIFQKRLGPVRRQLAAPDEVILDCFSVTLPKADRDARNLFFVREPSHLWGSIAIQMGQKLVFLPWVADGLYDALKMDSQKSRMLDYTIRGDSLPWPREPRHLADLGLIRGITIQKIKADAENETPTHEA